MTVALNNPGGPDLEPGREASASTQARDIVGMEMADELQALLDNAAQKANELMDLTEQAALEDAAAEAQRELEALAENGSPAKPSAGDDEGALDFANMSPEELAALAAMPETDTEIAQQKAQEVEDSRPEWEIELGGLLNEANMLTDELFGFDNDRADDPYAYDEVIMPNERVSDDLFDMSDELRDRLAEDEAKRRPPKKPKKPVAQEQLAEVIQEQPAEENIEAQAADFVAPEVMTGEAASEQVQAIAAETQALEEAVEPAPEEKQPKGEPIDAAMFASPEEVAQEAKAQKEAEAAAQLAAQVSEEAEKEEAKAEDVDMDMFATPDEIAALDEKLLADAQAAIDGELEGGFETVQEVTQEETQKESQKESQEVPQETQPVAAQAQVESEAESGALETDSGSDDALDPSAFMAPEEVAQESAGDEEASEQFDAGAFMAPEDVAQESAGDEDAGEQFDAGAFMAPEDVAQEDSGQKESDAQASNLEVVGSGSGLLNLSRDAVTDVYEDEFVESGNFLAAESLAEGPVDQVVMPQDLSAEAAALETPPIDENADISTIDDLLAQGAEDALVGGFESVEDVMGGGEAPEGAVAMGGETYTRLPADHSQEAAEAPPIIEKQIKTREQGESISVEETAVAGGETIKGDLSQEAAALEAPAPTASSEPEAPAAKAEKKSVKEQVQLVQEKLEPLKPAGELALKLVGKGCELANKPLAKFPEIRKYVGYAAMVTFINSLLMIMFGLMF